MNFTYDFPVIKNNPQKTASHKKIRRIGRLRLGDSYRNLRSRFELTPVKIPEDSGTEAYTLPMEKEILFHGVPVTAAGVSIKNRKVRAIHADTAASPDEMKRILTDLYGTPEKKNAAYFWADTVTTVCMTGENHTASVIIADTASLSDISDAENTAEEEERRGFKGRLWKKYGNPVGRVSRKTYIKRASLVGIPVIAMFAFTWIRPELFVGDANFFIIAFMVLGTLGFVSLMSLAIRRLSDIGLSHLYYWGFFGLLFIGNQAGGKISGNELLAARITGLVFFAVVFLLSFIPGENKKNKYGPVPKD